MPVYPVCSQDNPLGLVLVSNFLKSLGSLLEPSQSLESHTARAYFAHMRANGRLSNVALNCASVRRSLV